MKRFAYAAEFDHPAAEVLRRITTRDYLDFRYNDGALLHCEIAVLRDGEAEFECRVARTADTAKLPGIARRVLGGRVEFVQVHRWARSGPPFHGELEISVTGIGGSIRSALQLAPQGTDRTRFEVDGRIEARIPLLGGQIERLLASRAEENFQHSVAAMQTWLARTD